MGAHEDLPFTGWGCDDPESFPRPAERPVEARSPVATSPATGDAPRTVPARYAGSWDEHSEADSR